LEREREKSRNKWTEEWTVERERKKVETSGQKNGQ
jgi:hypothetical protein